MQHLAEAKRVFNAEIEGLDLVKSRLANEFEQAVDLILACQGKVVVAGIGKSGIIGPYVSYIKNFRQIPGSTENQ